MPKKKHFFFSLVGSGGCPPAFATGVDGNQTISTTVNLSTISKASTDNVWQFDNLDIQAGGKLVLDVGEFGEKTVFAGIKQAYSLDDLKDKLVVLVNNLKPREMSFGLSEGMILAAGPGGEEVYMIEPDSGAEPGMRVK